MPIAELGVIDLSIVTDRLITLLRDCVANSPMWTEENPAFTINVSGNAPDAVRSGSDCELSLCLFHVAQDKFQKNTPVSGVRIPQIPFQPLSLNLYYLLSAFAKDDYVKEQRAMSIALRCFHENPIVRDTVLFGTVPVAEEYTLTMEADTADEIARLWQATTVALRLSAVYKVSVVFMPPEAPTQAIAPPPTRVSLGADATSLPLAGFGQVTGTRRSVVYTFPSGTPAIAKQASYDLSPATAAPAQRFLLVGGGLNQSTSRRLYLLAPDGTEQEVTSWKVADPAPPTSVLQTESRFTIELPATVGAAPGDTPLPGLYQLRVGSDAALGDAQTTRSNATPFAIAARVNVAADPPILTDAAGLYTLNGLGFVPGSTEVLLDTVALAPNPGPPDAGEFNVDAAGTTMTFRAPTILAPGLYSVRVRVNHVESDPSWWIELT